MNATEAIGTMGVMSTAASSSLGLTTRPMWQRILLPVVGLLCLILATLGGFLPMLPGWPLAVIGIPLLMAFNPRYEAWTRRHRRRLLRIGRVLARRWWHRLRRAVGMQRGEGQRTDR